MMRDKPSREELLLDFHLDRTNDEERSWIEAELLRDTEFRARSDRLGDILRPLDYWTAAPAPPNLADKVLQSIAHARGAAHEDLPATVNVLPDNRDGRWSGYRGPLGSLRELVAVAACIGLLVLATVPGLAAVRSRAKRTQCASNLGSIFRGTMLYQQAFGGALPYVGDVSGASWLPNSPQGAEFASNSRHIYVVAKLNYGPKPENFVCPSSGKDRPMLADELANYNDFPRPGNLSYATLNMSGPRPNLRPPAPIPYVSDRNPLFVGGRFRQSLDPNTANSPSHRRRGQSVLILDGSVLHLTTPIYGAQRDNLWLAGSVRRYRGTEAPVADDDAFLIPGFPTADPHTDSRY